MAAVVLAGAVVKTGADEVEFPEQGPINEGMSPFPSPVRSAVWASLVERRLHRLQIDLS